MKSFENMILYDDRGLEVDFFKRTLEKNKKIAIQWSGGTDSSFTFWYFAKLIHDYDLKEHSLFPISGIEYALNYQPIDEMDKIYNFIKESFPNANILPRYTFDFFDDFKGPKDRYWNNEYYGKIIKEYNIDRKVSSTACSPLFEEVDWEPLGLTEIRKAALRISNNSGKNGCAWRLVDKKFIAYQYNKFNLMDTLFPLTHSCINPDFGGNPCKQCWWCKEKYWAFGYYDRKRK